MSTTQDPDEYVRQNRDTLIRIVKHGDDKFVRAMALAALVEYGDGPAIEDLEREVERARELQE
jgi:hypothetical protein